MQVLPARENSETKRTRHKEEKRIEGNSGNKKTRDIACAAPPQEDDAAEHRAHTPLPQGLQVAGSGIGFRFSFSFSFSFSSCSGVAWRGARLLIK